MTDSHIWGLCEVSLLCEKKDMEISFESVTLPLMALLSLQAAAILQDCLYFTHVSNENLIALCMHKLPFSGIGLSCLDYM